MLIHLIGGFLGGGKTTAIQQACSVLRKEERRVGVITNDQGTQLVDTHFLKGAAIPTEEVVGSCFCCNYPAFENHMMQLDERDKPDILFAESVGSCTDLVATIIRPLQRFHPTQRVVLSVFADAEVFPVLVVGSSLFKDSVNYIYKKQLEEADLLILSKCDRLSGHQRRQLEEVLTKHYPDKMVLFQNSYDEAHIRRWLQTASMVQQSWRKALTIDYAQYGAGEAELAWLNQQLSISNEKGQAARIAKQLINHLYQSILAEQLVVGHLKFLYQDSDRQEKISFTSGHATGQEVRTIPDTSGQAVDLLINARVQTSPVHLQQLVHRAIEEAEQAFDCAIAVLGQEAFMPGFPKPSHRILEETI
ncbi:GTP-binding protein [Olivibacter ginsenosidimutans]|uniref:GTP-binding protein n=1 Tax=Olivibacter ginsenosidimutans TaxID=1176537 RepID=A0ABP9C1N9_9SPHI